MPRKRIDISQWTKVLRTVWTLAPRVATAKFIFFVMRNQQGTIRSMRATLEIDEQLWVERALKKWDRELADYRVRMDVYAGRLKAATNADFEDVEREFIQPVLFGNYEAVTGTDEEGLEIFFPRPPFGWSQPDVQTGGILYNQVLAAIRAHRNTVSGTLATALCEEAAIGAACLNRLLVEHTGEWFTKADHQLHFSAPDERPTVADAAKQALIETGALLEEVGEKIKKGWEHRDIILGGVVAALVGYGIYRGASLYSKLKR